MNISMWRKALNVIPRISKEEWNDLDIISRWLISTRAVALVITFLATTFAGIFAIQDDSFHLVPWLLITAGLFLAHGTNNLVNDYVDYARGVDEDNYYRSQYGPQPLVHGLLSKRQLITYIVVTGLLSVAAGLPVVLMRGGLTPYLMGVGAFLVLFYTWPLKYYGLGEIAILLTWGPLIIGGGYYAITGSWSWNVVLASFPYALGVFGVILGKHIDKYKMDKELGIYTLPVIIGEQVTRYLLVGVLALQYLFVLYLVIIGFFTPAMLVVFLTLQVFRQILPMFRGPKPDEKPEGYPDVWPNYFVAGAFQHNRRFGSWFLLGLIIDTILTKFIL